MKKIILVLALGCALAGCRSDIDLANIDKTTEVDAGIALPVGTLRMTLKDMVGDVDNIYIDNGVVTWQMDTVISRNYHQVNLAKYLSSKELNMKVFDKLRDMGIADADGKVTTLPGKPVPVNLPFTLTLKLKGINNPDSLSKERLDSAWIDHANFASTIQAVNGLPLDWKWIDKVTLDLGAQIRRSAGNKMTVYQKGDNYDYGDSIPTDVDNFSLHMMKNKSNPPHYTNVIDSCQFEINFSFTIPADTSFYIPTDAAFAYKLDVQFIDYTAIWGMFSPSNDMQNEDVINISDGWGQLDFLTKSSLPFAEPVVDVNIQTKVAGALYIDSAYIFVNDQQGNRKYAEFYDDHRRYRHVDFRPDQYLDPHNDSQIGDSTTKMVVTFDNTPEGGRIDELFGVIPKDLGYRFMVRFNEGLTPQIRVVPSTAINVKAHTTLPFIFKEGVFVNYPDTFHNLDLSKVSLDSLKANSDVIDTISSSNLKIIMQATNWIPLHVKVAARCYDANDKMIMDPDDASQPFLIFDQDTIMLEPATLAKDPKQGYWLSTAGGVTTFISTVTKKDQEIIPTIKTISLHAVIDDKALKYAYDKGMDKIRLLADQDVYFKIGLTANVNAVLNFNNEKEDK